MTRPGSHRTPCKGSKQEEEDATSMAPRLSYKNPSMDLHRLGGGNYCKEGPRDAALEQQAEAQGVSPPRTHTPREHKHLWHLNTSPCYP